MPDELLGGWGAARQRGSKPRLVTLDEAALPPGWDYNELDLVATQHAKNFIRVSYSIGESAVFIQHRLHQANCMITEPVEQWIEETARAHVQSGTKAARKQRSLLKTALATFGFERETPMRDILEALREQRYDLSIALQAMYWSADYALQPIGECVFICSDPLHAHIDGCSRSFHLKICNFGGRRTIEDVPFDPNRKLRPDQQVVVGIRDLGDADGESLLD